MKSALSRPVIVADDDPDDILLLRAAWQRAGIPHPLICVENGIQLLELLRESPDRPAFLLMDVNMPGKTGHETLQDLKQDPVLCALPVVMLSTSTLESDISRAYQLGAATYFVKSPSVAEMTLLVRQLREYWLDSAELPAG